MRLLVGLALLLGSCRAASGDPAPGAPASAVVPVAPPGALGAYAGGRGIRRPGGGEPPAGAKVPEGGAPERSKVDSGPIGEVPL